MLKKDKTSSIDKYGKDLNLKLLYNLDNFEPSKKKLNNSYVVNLKIYRR